MPVYLPAMPTNIHIHDVTKVTAVHGRNGRVEVKIHSGETATELVLFFKDAEQGEAFARLVTFAHQEAA
jgi:hypothetical protein